MAFVPFARRDAAIGCVRHLRATARDAWASEGRVGVDISAIEHLDARCLALAREDGLDRKTGVTWPAGTAVALLVTIELPSTLDTFARLIDEAGPNGDVLIAGPGDRVRMAQLVTLREEIPASVNARVGRAKQMVDARIEKTAGDMIVPFERLEDFLACCDREFGRRHLDVAIWGHVSDGNLHPNVVPRSFADVEAGKAALLDIGRAVIGLGGSPLAEHGVGRNLVKQALVEELYGHDGLDAMRAVKRTLDPEWKLAPGVLFPVP